jgi:predicted permease
MNNLRYALRQLVRAPGFTLVALLTLALGIGFSASSFSLANVFLLRDVPYPESERLVRVFRTSRQGLQLPHTPANMLAIRAAAQAFSGLAIFNGDSFALGEPGQPAELVGGVTATADFLEVLRVAPALGRGFAPGDDEPGRPLVALLTQRAWQRRYGSDPAVLGRTVRLNSLAFTIVGVLPASFDAPLVWGTVEFVVPRKLEPSFRTDRSRAWMNAVGRLKPGVSLAQAAAELAALGERLAQDFPRENGGDGLRVVALHDSNMDGVSRTLLWLMTALSLVMLLIACANLASLQVARAFGRVREHAIRAALGGSRPQLMGPLLLESLLLALGGGALGLLVASWANDIVGSYLIINNEAGFAIPLDARVVAFAASGALVSGLTFGLAPAWIASRAPAAEALKEGSRSATAGPTHQRLKRVLLVSEMTLALALVGVAATFGVGARAFRDRALGWRPEGLFVGQISLPFNRYPENARVREIHQAMLEQLRALPGVEHAALANTIPVYSVGRSVRLALEGRPVPESGREPLAESAAVTADYFATIGLPLRQGRTFPAQLQADDPRLAVVNESFARQCWPGENALGRRFRTVDSDRWLEVVGVVGDVRGPVRIEAPETRLQFYVPLVQAPTRFFNVALRGAVAPETLAPAVRRIVAGLDADLPVAQPGAVRAQIERNLSNINLVIANLGISAGLGLLIAGLGLFGVMSQLTAQRTRDIGVRMALGASARDILGMVLGEAVRLLALGIAAGVPAMWALNLFLGRTLPEMPLPGAWLMAANIAVLSAAMLLACWLPARRATLVNPVEALRAE